MTSGTKILLLIIALFVGILILYYGFLMPPVAPLGAKTAETAAPAVDDPAPTRSSAVVGGGPNRRRRPGRGRQRRRRRTTTARA